MLTKKTAVAPPPRSKEDPARPAAEWGEARLIYPLYAQMAVQFDLGVPPCGETDLAGEGMNPVVLKSCRQWFDEMDQRVQVHQLRQLLQSGQTPSEESLRALSLRHLRKKSKGPADRDKIDFLLVQYLALCAPAELYHRELGLEEVAEILEPLLGPVDAAPLDWCEPLEKAVETMNQCRSLRDLLERGILEQGRRVKESAGNMFYDPAALVAFTRFNFLLRRSLIRLMHEDLRAIREALGNLESRGIRAVDCRRAGLSAVEPTSRLMQIVQEWKQPFTGNYTANSVGGVFVRLLALRAATEKALGVSPQEAKPAGHTSPPAAAPQTAAPKGAEPAVRPGPKPAVAASGAPAGVPPAVTKPAVPPAKETASAAAPQAPQKQAGAAAKSGAPSKPQAKEVAQGVTALDRENCLETIWEQLISAPPGRGRSMTTVMLQNTRLMLSSWEVAAFVTEGGQVSEDLQRAVVARALVAMAMETRKKTGEAAPLEAALAQARTEVSNLQARVDEAKSAKDTEAAVNLNMTAKRLLAFIEEAENLSS